MGIKWWFYTYSVFILCLYWVYLEDNNGNKRFSCVSILCDDTLLLSLCANVASVHHRPTNLLKHCCLPKLTTLAQKTIIRSNQKPHGNSGGAAEIHSSGGRISLLDKQSAF
ncbi:hypothetical protein ATANTOWER_011442 [Ataeniobius toweri]|uniref:Secreted protein n=1 Tax=Ataeniobius toweri TaxID=208326 RepID=A0ABU7AC24_9TELE|nr:hypothetical protein [Ataeniobius toweri]